jgi:ATP synthase protein I
LQASLAAESGLAANPIPDAIGAGDESGTGAVNLDSPAADAATIAVSAGDEYGRLQRRLLLATLLVTVVAALITWPVWGASTARSLLLGGCCGLLYLRLLARSVGRIGPDSRSLGRFQIVVPALLVVAAARVPAIELLPAILGFLLYKPALLLQAVLAP